MTFKFYLFMVALLVLGIAYTGIFHGFGAQCKDAGFTGMEYEECVHLKQLGKWPLKTTNNA